MNQPITEAHFDTLLADVRGYLDGLPELFVEDLYCGADPAYRLSCRYVTPNAWHANFVRNMFIRPAVEALAAFAPNFTILHAPEFQADPARHGTRTGTFIILHLARRTILIGGTRYAGELKKSMFTVMNYLLPKQGVLSMHCSANIGPAGDTALFFGLSGTGKTTLSADPERGLIGDDEHGWSAEGVFNFEGLLREGHQPLARQSPTSTPRPRCSGPSSRTSSSSRGRAASTSPTSRSPRTPAPRIRSITSGTTCRAGAAATRRTWSS